ncbi:MAG: helix-turn-helix domain-containing protein [Microbacteriaceae bacterium]
MPAIQDDEFYKPHEAAELMKVTYQTVLQEIHANRLHAVAVGSKPLYRVPGWALRDYQEGRAPRATSMVASVGSSKA